MNSFTNTILTLLLGWLRTLLNVARDFISSDSSTAFFEFFRNNWQIIFLVLCIGGFVLDKIVYLIRWRPSPAWLRRRTRRDRYEPQPEEAYDLPDFDTHAPAIPTDDYGPVEEYPYAETAPTMQYQIHSQQQERQAYDTRPAYPPYTTPQYAPEAAPNAYQEGETPLRWDEASQGHTFAPAGDRQQRFAFGMAPSFGSAQSEPAYNYHRDAVPNFAPPQHAQEYGPTEPFAPPYVPDQEAVLYEDSPQAPYRESSPQFRPFSDRGGETYSPPRTRGLGAVAKKARDLLNADEAYESLSYQDLQPTVDVTKAFHSPVYPEKKPEGDA